ncbi:uncharacterized protein FPRO_08378 [Fusarium proliferatum ET1]|uniref:Uncharacterized protein n=1 Tax=Fusarium proliferatum (strain ET1) TaxID=1227346 RepID=A0A1L7W310_FUSPR|nr:uncharacterized protein FPRO_08378 [Fusarium proliferatum ET1]CZR47004.1 uncharacterized protein FPRO_08378 [Fusarium proliferatum ET1]
MAMSLGYVDCPATPDEETRQLYFHNDEIFITDGISASENRILAAFGGKKSKDEPVLISELTIEKRMLLSELMPAEVELEDVIGKGEITKRLASELFHRTGVLAYGQYYLLVRAICGRPLRDGITENDLSQR